MYALCTNIYEIAQKTQQQHTDSTKEVNAAMTLQVAHKVLEQHLPWWIAVKLPWIAIDFFSSWSILV